MKPRTRTLILAILGLILGVLVGGTIGLTSFGGVGTLILETVIGGLLGALVLGMIGSASQVPFTTLADLIECGECCSMLTVFCLVSVVTISSLVIWHSLLLALLVGIGVMTASFILLSVAVFVQRASYLKKDRIKHATFPKEDRVVGALSHL